MATTNTDDKLACADSNTTVSENVEEFSLEDDSVSDDVDMESESSNEEANAGDNVDDDDVEDEDIEETGAVDEVYRTVCHFGLPFISKYERAALLIKRVEQIEKGALPLISLLDHMTPREQALAELESGLFPLMLERKYVYGGRELIRPSNLTYIEF